MSATLSTVVRRLPRAVTIALRARIEAVCSWYQGCDVCPETLANVNRELSSVLRDLAPKCPYVLRARFDGACLVVGVVPWGLS